jgi:hypothetical protein
MLERQKKVRALAWRIGGSAVLIVLIVLAIMIVRGCDSIIVSPSDTPTWTPTSTQTPVLIPTPTSPPPSDTPAPTPTLTPTRVTPSATATATSTAISTPGPPDVATVIHSSGASIYAAPNSSSQELGGVPSGKQVKVLARSVYGDWLYVRYGGVEGFTYAPRYEWEGDYELLPVKESLAVPAPTSPSSGNALEMDLWDLPDGWCSGGRWYKNVFIQGRGGNGVYTYYWNGERLAGPLTNEGYTFEVYSVGGAVIGTGKVVSGDGQEIERHLYVSVASCHQ